MPSKAENFSGQKQLGISFSSHLIMFRRFPLSTEAQTTGSSLPSSSGSSIVLLHLVCRYSCFSSPYCSSTPSSLVISSFPFFLLVLFLSFDPSSPCCSFSTVSTVCLSGTSSQEEMSCECQQERRRTMRCPSLPRSRCGQRES